MDVYISKPARGSTSYAQVHTKFTHQLIFKMLHQMRLFKKKKLAENFSYRKILVGSNKIPAPTMKVEPPENVGST